MNPTFKLLALTCIVVAYLPSSVRAQQCLANVTHAEGTQTVGCTDVTVTYAGYAFNNGFMVCGVGPYVIGTYLDGSYTFTFSQPIASAVFNITALQKSLITGANEEIFVYVNGAPYFLDNAGDTGACFVQAEVTPSGTLEAPNESVAMSDNVVVNGPISTLTIECRQTGTLGYGNGVLFSLFICCCVTDAGILTASPSFLCPSEPANVPPATQTALDGDDLLQYILFSDLNDTLGSIISTSDMPTFLFNPATMQTGVVYYIAAIAGNNVNDNVDLNDPCLDLSNAIQVTWRPQPAVVFSVADPDVCVGNCTTVTANFTGTAPFTLTYNTLISGSVTQVFSGNTGTFQVCAALGSPPGNLVVQAEALEDAFCSCP
ncbi:MAG: hypothetical protein IT270_01435 [Saprospiraceae bacterium]|nr:hypothetical protein [Saprospiraceae bacterium]